jgi:hypothetical protein
MYAKARIWRKQGLERKEEKRREESHKEKSVDLAANQSKVRVGLTFFNHKYMVLK